MKLLIDTNVLLDIVLKRNTYNSSIELFRRIRTSGVSAFVTASSITDLFYIIRKETRDTRQTYGIMKNIFKLVSVLSVTDRDIQVAFQKEWKDFEDCLQYVTANNNRMDYIITSNYKDFEETSVPVLTPDDYIKMLR